MSRVFAIATIGANVYVRSRDHCPPHVHNLQEPNRITILEADMTDLISEADYLKALQSGHRRSVRELRALAVAYNSAQDTVDIVMAEGWRIQIDRARIAELAGLSPSALENLSLSPAGTAIELDAEDVHISLERLLATIIPVKALARRNVLGVRLCR